MLDRMVRLPSKITRDGLCRRAAQALGLVAFGWSFQGCTETPSKQPMPAEPSPNASILPAPLASELDAVPKAPPPDAGLVSDARTEVADAETAAPVPLRADRALEPDAVSPEAPSERWIAQLRWLDQPVFPRLPELSVEATERLREELAFSVLIDLSAAGRLRLVFDSNAFVLPAGSELRAREDRYGHILLWNSAQSYVSLAPGMLRAVLSERRADAAPLTKPRLAELGAGSVLGLPTRKLEVGTPLGRLILDQTAAHAVGSGASLVCRLLLEMIAADPQSTACSRRELPLRAELFSAGGGHLVFEVKKRVRDSGLDPQTLLAPPPEARLVIGELPEQASVIVPTRNQLRDLRIRPATRSEKLDPTAPKQGLLLQNWTEDLRYVLLDGVVLARIPPHREVAIEGLLPGKYALSSLDFFGDDPTPLRIVELPARIPFGVSIEPER